jgi:hypothetical protein
MNQEGGPQALKRRQPKLRRHDGNKLRKNSGFGWRSAFSAAVNALESVKALAAEVTESSFSAACESSCPSQNGDRRSAGQQERS